jgi:glycosyltransferase involved in cell wall biosynthesis
VRVAIAHHWFVTQGGGERVAEVLGGLFPQADIFTLVSDSEYLPQGLAGRRLTNSFLQKIPGARRVHRHMLPLYPLAAEHLDLTDYDLVLSSDSGPIKGVRTRHDAVHVCYCHSPMRYLWDGYTDYLDSMPLIAKLPFALSARYVRRWDYTAAQRVTHFIANSRYVAERIQRAYGRSSEVIHPPIDTHRGFIAASTEDYYLAAGRLVPYKKTEILIEACNRLRRKLRVAGVGPDLERLRRMAGPTIEFVGKLSTPDLWNAYAHCRALLFAADEDFGMIPLEAQACGRPVVAYGKGGSLETVRSEDLDATGVFFERQTPESVTEAILRFESKENSFDPKTIQAHAHCFDVEVFVEQIRRFLNHVAPGNLSEANTEKPAQEVL